MMNLNSDILICESTFSLTAPVYVDAMRDLMNRYPEMQQPPELNLGRANNVAALVCKT